MKYLRSLKISLRPPKRNLKKNPAYTLHDGSAKFALWWHSKGKYISHFIAETSIAETSAPNCPIP